MTHMRKSRLKRQNRQMRCKQKVVLARTREDVAQGIGGLWEGYLAVRWLEEQAP